MSTLSQKQTVAGCDLPNVGVRPAPPVLSEQEFEALMVRFGPFEQRPLLAVGLSGGADSTALVLLAQTWAQARGGKVIALIVDHGLRDESAIEAQGVARSCQARGIDAEVLTHRGSAVISGIEEAAREARHRLLGEACCRLGALHLLLAHHHGDQAETVAMRRQHGSTRHGLAGISGCVERVQFRVLRPLLALPKDRLVATLKWRGETWVEDPMNRDLRFARARLRHHGVPEDPDQDAGNVRVELERALAQALPAIVGVDRFGVGRLDRTGWLALPSRLGLFALAHLAQTLGGLDYAPRGERLEALAQRLRGDGPVSATLGRCQWKGTNQITVVRERRHLPRLDVSETGPELLWDGRFRVTLPAG
ncbi:MAG: tRNA lysidine(34) synthetase TilS, partial [Rhodospirillaceae bacterium]|nr:tRNA lysidine(34) synthetase TilS [Rhodospirillaceae bacterium]